MKKVFWVRSKVFFNQAILRWSIREICFALTKESVAKWFCLKNIFADFKKIFAGLSSVKQFIESVFVNSMVGKSFDESKIGLGSVKNFSIFFVLIFSSHSFGQSSNVTRVNNGESISATTLIDHLKDEGQIGIFDTPAVSVFEESCSNMIFSSLDNASRTFCEAVVSSEVCQSVEKKDLMNCAQYEESKDLSVVELLKGCGYGVLNTTKQIVSFIWSMIKIIANPEQTFQEASEYFESVKLYIATEYDKAYDRASPPFRKTKATSAVAGQSMNIFFNAIQNYLSTEYKEFGCLNAQARTEKICTAISDVIVSSVGGGIFLKLRKIRKNRKEKMYIIERALRLEDNGKVLKEDLYVQFHGSIGKIVDVQKGKVLFRHRSGDMSSIRKKDLDYLEIANEDSKNFFQKRFLEMTKDPEMNEMRKALNTNKIPEGKAGYVSYRDSSGTDLIGKIEDVKSDKVLIVTSEGKQLDFSDKGELSRISVSESSKEFFDSFDTFQQNALNGTLKKGEHRFVSYIDDNGKTVFGKLQQGNGWASIETPNGDFISFTPRWLDSKSKRASSLRIPRRDPLYPSSSSKELFDSIDSFRSKVVAGQLSRVDNRYVSYRDPQGKKVSGRITNQKDNDGRFLIESIEGDRISLTDQPSLINTIYPSSSSKELFNSLDSFRSNIVAGHFIKYSDGNYVSFRNPQGNKVLGRVAKEDDRISIETMDGDYIPLTDRAIDTIYPNRASKEYFKNRFRIDDMTGNFETRQMRISLNNNEIPQLSSRHVSYRDPQGNKVIGEIIGVNEDAVLLKAPNGTRIELEGHKRRNLTPSASTRDYFDELDSFREQISKGTHVDEIMDEVIKSDLYKRTNGYISYMNSEGNVVFGRLVKRYKRKSWNYRLSIQTEDGKYINLKKDTKAVEAERLQITPSESAREYFREFVEK